MKIPIEKIPEAVARLQSEIEKTFDTIIDTHRPGTLETERPSLKAMMRDSNVYCMELISSLYNGVIDDALPVTSSDRKKPTL